MEKEAIVMRIITIVTLVYLPATFVSVSSQFSFPPSKVRKLNRILGKTFFSTDIVKYQNQNGGRPNNGTFSKQAMNRWLQVTLPLTFVTIVIAALTLRIAERKRQRQEHPIKKQQKKWVKPVQTKAQQPPILPLHNTPKVI
jgi:hypothetical protein